MGIDAECYEVAEVDGANILRKIWGITIPLLVPTMVILILLRLGRILRGDFEMFYQLIGNAGVLYDKTDVIDTFVFRSPINASDIGMASATESGIPSMDLPKEFVKLAMIVIATVKALYWRGDLCACRSHAGRLLR